MPAHPPRSPRCYGLVPCAGSGSRAGLDRPKQYALLAGRPMVEHTLRALAGVGRLASTLVVLARNDELYDRMVTVPSEGRFEAAHCGAATRAGTVAAGLAALAADGASADDWVLVHDAARCLVRAEWVDALIDACLGDAVGGLLAWPVADTLKREAEGRSSATFPRSGLWLAQTPQMFRLGTLSEALARVGDAVTDEAGAIEQLGLAPKLVRGHAENFKLTEASDFALAETILRARAA